MLTQHKFNTPHMDYSETVLQEAHTVFTNTLETMGKGDWEPKGMFKDRRGYSVRFTSSPPPTLFSLWGAVLYHWETISDRPYAEATLELILAIMGSEATKMQYTSPRIMESAKGIDGIIEFLKRCINTVQGIYVNKNVAREQEYFDGEAGRGLMKGE